jgi:hypothetical protein
MTTRAIPGSKYAPPSAAVITAATIRSGGEVFKH